MKLFNFKRLISVPGITLVTILAIGSAALLLSGMTKGLWAWSGISVFVLYLFLKK